MLVVWQDLDLIVDVSICNSAVAIYDLGHAIGFEPEQARANRDGMRAGLGCVALRNGKGSGASPSTGGGSPGRLRRLAVTVWNISSPKIVTAAVQ